jgi:hypothetical protein
LLPYPKLPLHPPRCLVCDAGGCGGKVKSNIQITCTSIISTAPLQISRRTLLEEFVPLQLQSGRNITLLQSRAIRRAFCWLCGSVTWAAQSETPARLQKQFKWDSLNPHCRRWRTGHATVENEGKAVCLQPQYSVQYSILP